MAVADVEIFVHWILPKLGVELVALVELVYHQVALAPERGQARGQSVLSGVESRGALHFWARLDACRLEGLRQLLGDDLKLFGELEVLPDPSPLALILALCGILSCVALPGLGPLFQEFHALLRQLSLGVAWKPPGPINLLQLWPVGELDRLCLDLARSFPSPVTVFQLGSLART